MHAIAGTGTAEEAELKANEIEAEMDTLHGDTLEHYKQLFSVAPSINVECEKPQLALTSSL